jgi:hypothetical protein
MRLSYARIFVELAQAPILIGEQLPCQGRQLILAIFQNLRQAAAQPPDVLRNDDTKFTKQATRLVDQRRAFPNSSERIRWSIITDCCSSSFTGTLRMLGRPTASQIACASLRSVLSRRRLSRASLRISPALRRMGSVP